VEPKGKRGQGGGRGGRGWDLALVQVQRAVVGCLRGTYPTQI